jgi:hypothetical protein
MVLKDIVLERVPAVFDMEVIAAEFSHVRVKIDNYRPGSQEISNTVRRVNLALTGVVLD